MKMLTLAVVLAALTFPAAAQSTAKVEPQPAVKSTTHTKSGAKATKTHHKSTHKTHGHKKKPAAAKT